MSFRFTRDVGSMCYGVVTMRLFRVAEPRLGSLVNRQRCMEGGGTTERAGLLLLENSV